MSEINDLFQITNGIIGTSAQMFSTGGNLVIGIGGKAIEVTGQLTLEIIKGMTKFLGICGSKAWDAAWKKNAQKTGSMSPQSLMKRYGAELEVDRVVIAMGNYGSLEKGKKVDDEIWKKTFEKNLKKLGIPFSSAPAYIEKNKDGKEMLVMPVLYPPIYAQRVEEARIITINQVQKRMTRAGWDQGEIKAVTERDAPMQM